MRLDKPMRDDRTDAIAQHCIADEWPRDARTCALAAASLQDLKPCLDKLTEKQRDAIALRPWE